ncbi:hypothetical protein [Jiulongibacter sp. NS-SX5]|uniref:hypothetical protein n=1 Tax=Jiulongibacter sp. NS-SX5 TaxID=3463854 RepID=UPI004059DA61
MPIIDILDSTVIKVTIFLVFLSLLVFEMRRGQLKKLSGYLLFFLSVIFMFTFKWYPLVFNGPLNGDEAFVYSTALTLLNVDPIPFRYIDFTTLGPVHNYFFLIPQFLGFKVSFTGIRWVWIASLILTLILTYKSLVNFYGKRNSLLFFFYPFLLWATSYIYDFNFFYNELTCSLFLSAGLYLFSKNLRENEIHKNLFDFLSVILLSISVYAKPHAALFAFTIVFFIMLNKLIKEGLSPVYILKFIVSGFAFSVFFLGFLYFHDSLDEFFLFYIDINLGYGNKIGLQERIFNAFVVRSTTEPGLNYFVKHLYLLLTLTMPVILLLRKRFWNIKSIFIVVFSVVTIISISIPGTNYGHYYNFILLSLPLMIGYIGQELKGFWQSLYKWSLIVLCTIFFMFSLRSHTFRYDNLKENERDYYTNLVRTDVSKTLLKKASEYKMESPKLAIFDWRNEIYIETGFMPATHYTMPERLIGGQVPDLEIVSKTRKIYLDDLKKNRPEFFLVAKGTTYSYWDMTLESMKEMPNIYEYFVNNYSLIGEQSELEIYIRNDYKGL